MANLLTSLIENIPTGLNQADREKYQISHHRVRRIHHLFIKWEAWKRRRDGGMWVALNRGQAGAARAIKLVQYLKQRDIV